MPDTTSKTFHRKEEKEEMQIVCEFCKHFRQDEGNMGYCLFHHVYVMADFNCKNFLLKNNTTLTTENFDNRR